MLINKPTKGKKGGRERVGVPRPSQKMAAAVTDTDLVADLLKTPFSKRSFQDKKEIIEKGRPMPNLDLLTMASNGLVHHFKDCYYEHYEWLTASAEHSKLFCWPCLLFNTSKRTWNDSGFDCLNGFTKAAHRHQSSERHIMSVVHWKTFGECWVDLQPVDQRKQEISVHNERVRKNRDILKRLIDCVLFLAQHELSFRGYDESRDSLNRDTSVELLMLLAEHDADLQHHLDTATVFTASLGKIQNDLRNAVAEVMNHHIKDEIKQSKFVAIMVDEVTDLNNTVQLSFVLRYVTELGVKERFLKLEDITDKKPSHDVARLVLDVLESYDCKSKLVAQCYDGAVVMASGLNGVQAAVKDAVPQALFVHCYAHTLTTVMSQGASKIKECKIFFANLCGLSAFFTRSPKRTKLLDEFCQRQPPHMAQVRWNSNARLVCTVHSKRVELVELFQHILDHAEDFDSDTVHCASGHLSHLKSFDFCFFLFSLTGIFDVADVLFGILQSKTADVKFNLEKIADFSQVVERKRAKFNDIYDKTTQVAGQPSTLRRKPETRAYYRELHMAVIDNILAQIRNRFEDHQRLMFVGLLDSKHFEKFKQMFPEAELRSLKDSYGAQFDLNRLKAELKVMYNMPNFHGKSVSNLLVFLSSTGLADTMTELHTLICLILTIPVSAASVERSFSALKRIKTYARSITGQTKLPPLASLSIEKDLLNQLKQKGHLHEDVIERFVKKDRRMDFIYK